MEQEITVKTRNGKMLSYKEIQESQLGKINAVGKKEIVDYLNENKKALTSVRKFLGNSTAELTDEFINENLKDDAKHLLSDISKSKEKCYLGLYKLNEMERNAKKICQTDDFWDWADTVTSVKPYSLQSPELDSIISKSLEEVSEKITDKNFNLILKITTNNASTGSLKVFSRMISELKAELEEVDAKVNNTGFLGIGKKDDGKFLMEQEKERQEIVRKASSIFENLNQIIEHHYRNKSYKFYFEMSPEEIEEICRLSKSIKSKDLSVNWLETLMRNLVTYYVSFAREFSSAADISSLCDNWKLRKIFEIVYDYSSDNDLQEKILDSFSVDNSYLPYLPIDIIESTFNQNDESKQRNVIYYLEHRYGFSNEKEKGKINHLNDQIILDKTKSIALRAIAFDWFYNKVEPEDKEKWCKKILSELLKQAIESNFEKEISFTEIVNKCYDAISDKDSLTASFTNYITHGKNEKIIRRFEQYVSNESTDYIESLQGLVLKLIATDDDEKISSLCNYLSKLNDESMLDSSEGQRGIKHLCEKYDTSKFKEEIFNFANDLITKEVEKEKKRLYLDLFICAIAQSYANSPSTTAERAIVSLLNSAESANFKEQLLEKVLKIFYENKESEKQFLVGYTTTLFSKENSTEFNLKLLEEFFENALSNTNAREAEKYIDYIWTVRENAPSTVQYILDSVCNYGNFSLIRYVVSKGWDN